MTRIPLRNSWIAAAVVLLAAGAAPALAQHKAGHGVDVTVYESPT